MREPLRPPVVPDAAFDATQLAAAAVADLVPDLDPVAARRWRSRARAASPWLHEEIGQRMAQRLDWLVQPPSAWVSWHPLLGGLQAQQAVQARYPAAHWQALDEQGQPVAGQAAPAQPVQPTAAPPNTTPTAPASKALIVPGQADMLWANMALHLYARPQALLANWRDWLRPRDCCFFPALGPTPCWSCAASIGRWAGRRRTPPTPICTTGAICWCLSLIHI